MIPKIQLDIRLSTLLENYPETRPVFVTHGLGKLVSGESLQAVGRFLTLETALRNHGIAPQDFLHLLHESRHEEIPLDAPGMADNPGQEPGSLLTLMPCGLKVPFGKALASFMQNLQERNGEAIGYSVESNLNHEVSYYPYVSHLRSLNELPDIVVSSDFNPFFYHSFYKRFVETGHFAGVMGFAPNTLFADAGICDPAGNYNILCVNPLIIVADLKKAGDRPLPKCWADLLNPVWERDITLRGDSQFFCHAVLLPIYKEHGEEGMRALAKNIFDGRHPSQMVKTAGSGKSAALYVMPDFFARKIPDRSAVKRIWPEDGALASPVTLLVKKEKAEALKPVTDYLVGEELAQLFAGAHFPSPRPDANNPVSPGKRLKWLGWDYMRANDIGAVNDEIDRIFLPVVREGSVS